MELNLAPWIKKRVQNEKKSWFSWILKERQSIKRRDELDAKMVSRPFKVNLYLDFDLMELQNEATIHFSIISKIQE